MTIAKSQALEIVYYAYGAAVGGVVGEVKRISWSGAQTKSDMRKYKLTKHMFLHSDLLKLYPNKSTTSMSSSLTQLCFMIKNSRCELMG